MFLNGYVTGVFGPEFKFRTCKCKPKPRGEGRGGIHGQSFVGYTA